MTCIILVHRLESIVADANLDLELLGNSSSLRSQVQFGKGQFSMILHVILFLQKKILWNRFANCYFEEKRIVFHGDQNSFVIRHPSCLDEGNLKMSLFLGNQRKFNQFLNLRLPFQRFCVPLRSLTFYVMCIWLSGNYRPIYTQ